LGRLREAHGPWVTDLPRQLLIIGGGALGYALTYPLLKWLYPGDLQRRVGIDTARHVIDLERWLRVFNERDLQQAVSQHSLLSHFFYAIYLWSHIPLIFVIAVWLYSYHRPTFNLIRNAMLISGGLALLCELYPVAPPHLVPNLHMVKPAAGRLYEVVEPKGFFASYGAVPSIHVSWSLMMALAVWWHARSPWLRYLALPLPVLMSLAIVATGNHYWFDAFTGVIAAVIGLWLGRRRQSAAGSRQSGAEDGRSNEPHRI